MGDWQEFEGLIQRCGMTKTAFAETMGVTPAGVYRWKRGGVPKYALVYLRLLVEYNRVRP